MLRDCSRFVALILVQMALACAASAQDDLTAAPSTIRDGESGIVLLQDGGVLEGRITRAADWYVVGRAGGQVQIASSRVLCICRSLHEAYDYRCKRLNQPTGETHLALAEWCLRYNLVDEAAGELKAARELRRECAKAGTVGSPTCRCQRTAGTNGIDNIARKRTDSDCRKIAGAIYDARSAQRRVGAIHAQGATGAREQLHGVEMPRAGRQAIVPTQSRTAAGRSKPQNDHAESIGDASR